MYFILLFDFIILGDFVSINYLGSSHAQRTKSNNPKIKIPTNREWLDTKAGHEGMGRESIHYTGQSGVLLGT